jgi:hypothetical protein
VSVKERIEALIKEAALPDAVVVCDLVDFNDLWNESSHPELQEGKSLALLCAHDDGRYSSTPVFYNDFCPRGHLYLAMAEELNRLISDYDKFLTTAKNEPVREPQLEDYMVYSAQGWNV